MLGGAHQGLDLLTALICLGVYSAVIGLMVWGLIGKFSDLFRPSPRRTEDAPMKFEARDITDQDEIHIHGDGNA